MAYWLNQVLAKTVSLAPRPLIRWIAHRYVAGDTLEDAIQLVPSLAQNGYSATIDVLGEHISDLTESYPYVATYQQLIGAISVRQLAAGISLKLSQFGLSLDPEQAWNHLSLIMEQARQSAIFIRLDMEDSSLTDAILTLFSHALAEYPQTGVTIQACLKRSIRDVETLLAVHPNIRICKGIYKEPPEIAYQDRDQIRHNYMVLVRLLLEHGGYVAIATHDPILIDESIDFIENNRITPDRFEFQALLGVPIQKTLSQLIQKGYHVRLYIPYGEDWYPYSIRRLKENPDIAGYVIKNFFTLRSR